MNKNLHITGPTDENYKKIKDHDGTDTNLELSKNGLKVFGELFTGGDIKLALNKKIWLSDNTYLVADSANFITLYIHNTYAFRFTFDGTNRVVYLKDATLMLNNAGTSYIVPFTDGGGEDYIYFTCGNQFMMTMQEGTYEQINFLQHTALTAAKKLYFDGGGAGDTYITEFAADDLRLYVGNVLFFKMIQDDASDDYIEMENTHLHMGEGKKLYFDGGGDTYIYNGSDDVLDIVVGSDILIRMTEAGGGASNNVTIGDANLVCSYDLKIAATKKLYLDTGGDTYIDEPSADLMQFTVGGDIMLKLDENGSTGNVANLGTTSVGFTQGTPTYNASDTEVNFHTGGMKQYLTFGSGNITDLNLNFPLLSCNCTLVIKQDGTGSRLISNWKTFDESGANASTVKWAGSEAPTLSTGANAIDIVSFYWDSINHTAYGVASLNFG